MYEVCFEKLLTLQEKCGHLQFQHFQHLKWQYSTVTVIHEDKRFQLSDRFVLDLYLLFFTSLGDAC